MLIDLSVLINENTPVYPGDPKTKISPVGVFEKDGYEDHNISIGTHVGTHIDSPAHMVIGGKTMDQLPIENFFGKGILINTGKNFDLNIIKSANIEEGDIVLFYTGMGSEYYSSSYYDDYPDLTEEVARYLVNKKVKMVGVDMCSPDHPPFPIHQILLSNGILIIENLTNLEKLQGKNFKIYSFPIRIDIDGSPCRVVAETY